MVSDGRKRFRLTEILTMWNCLNLFLGAWAGGLCDLSPDFRVVAVPPPWSWAEGPAERQILTIKRQQPLPSPDANNPPWDRGQTCDLEFTGRVFREKEWG